MQKSVLILDPETSFGEAAAEGFWNAGWHIALATSDDPTRVPEIIVAERATLRHATALARQNGATLVVPRGTCSRASDIAVRAVSLDDLAHADQFGTPPKPRARRRRRHPNPLRLMRANLLWRATLCPCRPRA